MGMWMTYRCFSVRYWHLNSNSCIVSCHLVTWSESILCCAACVLSSDTPFQANSTCALLNNIATSSFSDWIWFSRCATVDTITQSVPLTSRMLCYHKCQTVRKVGSHLRIDSESPVLVSRSKAVMAKVDLSISFSVCVIECWLLGFLDRMRESILSALCLLSTVCGLNEHTLYSHQWLTRFPILLAHQFPSLMKILLRNGTFQRKYALRGF